MLYKEWCCPKFLPKIVHLVIILLAYEILRNHIYTFTKTLTVGLILTQWNALELIYKRNLKNNDNFAIKQQHAHKTCNIYFKFKEHNTISNSSIRESDKILQTTNEIKWQEINNLNIFYRA